MNVICEYKIREDMNDQSEDIFDNNRRLKAVIYAHGEY